MAELRASAAVRKSQPSWMAELRESGTEAVKREVSHVRELAYNEELCMASSMSGQGLGHIPRGEVFLKWLG